MEAESIEARIGDRLDQGDLAGASAIAIRAYGPGILATSSRSSPTRTTGLPAPLLGQVVGVYKLARNAAMRFLSSPRRTPTRRLRTSEALVIAAEVVSTMTPRARGGMSSARDAMADPARAETELASAPENGATDADSFLARGGTRARVRTSTISGRSR